MKKSILVILTALFLLTSCKSFKKVFKRSDSTKITKESKEHVRDSTSLISETLPTINTIVLTEDDFKLRGDFEQSVYSGDNEATIGKRDGKVYLTTKSAGSKNTTTTTKEKNKEKSSYIETFISEYKSIVERIPTRYYFYIAIVFVVWQRKLISQILVAMFPSLGVKRIFKLFLGQKLD